MHHSQQDLKNRVYQRRIKVFSLPKSQETRFLVLVQDMRLNRLRVPGDRLGIDGGLGNDSIWLGGGQDTVILAKGNGIDTIYNFQLGQTRLSLSGGLTFGELQIPQSTGAILIEIAATGEDLARLSGVKANNISADDFLFV